MKKIAFVFVLITFMFLGVSQLYSAEGKLKNDRFLKDKNGNITGFRFDISNISKDGSCITAITFYIVIYKWEDGKKVFYGLESKVWDCNVYQGYYESFEFDLKKWYGKADDFDNTWGWTFMSTK